MAASPKVRWFVLAACTFLIVQGALLPPDRIPRIFSLVNDKFVHGAEYFLLFFAARPAFESLRSGRALVSDLSLTAFFYCAFWGGLTEILQRNVPGRSPDWHDWYANLAGAGLAFLFLTFAAIFEELFVLRKDRKR